MRRYEVTSQYRVVKGRIMSPGKFEGEAIYMPAMYDISLDGCCDYEENDDGETVYSIPIHSQDRFEFPELIGKDVVRFVETDSGFVVELEES